MTKISNSSEFSKNYNALRPYGVLASAIYGYVEQFEKNKRPCFASRQHIAKELYSSPGSVARAIATLIKAGLLVRNYQGKKRILSTVKANPIVIKTEGHRDHSDQGTLINMINYKDLDKQRSRYKDLLLDNNNNNLDQNTLERINGAAEKFKLKKRF